MTTHYISEARSSDSHEGAGGISQWGYGAGCGYVDGNGDSEMEDSHFGAWYNVSLYLVFVAPLFDR